MHNTINICIIHREDVAFLIRRYNKYSPGFVYLSTGMHIYIISTDNQTLSFYNVYYAFHLFTFLYNTIAE